MKSSKSFFKLMVVTSLFFTIAPMSYAAKYSGCMALKGKQFLARNVTLQPVFQPGPTVVMDIHVKIDDVRNPTLYNDVIEYNLGGNIQGMPFFPGSYCIENAETGIITWVSFVSADHTRSVPARNLACVPPTFNAPIATVTWSFGGVQYTNFQADVNLEQQ